MPDQVKAHDVSKCRRSLESNFGEGTASVEDISDFREVQGTVRLYTLQASTQSIYKDSTTVPSVITGITCAKDYYSNKPSSNEYPSTSPRLLKAS